MTPTKLKNDIKSNSLIFLLTAPLHFTYWSHSTANGSWRPM